MSDQIDRAAKVIADFNACGHCEGTCGTCRGEAEALDAAGLLATPARDAGVAAKALRGAATDAAYGIDWDDVPESVESWLRDRAIRIEAGESDD